MRELSEFHPNEDRIGQMKSVVQIFEEEILEWERTRTVRPDSAAEAGSDPGKEQGQTWQELVEMREEILAEAEDAEDLELGPDNEWAQQVLQQATKVSCMAREICDNSAKAGWQPCTYSEYRWLMGQEIRPLRLLRWPGGRRGTHVHPEESKDMVGGGARGCRAGQKPHTVGAQSIARLCQNLINCRRNI